MKKIALILSCTAYLLASDPVALDVNSANACYKQRDVMHGLEEVFEALKKVLIQSNLNIVTVTKQDGVLTAKGSQYNDGDTVTEITVSLSFKGVDENKTHVAVIGSYNVMEKKSDIGQIGAGGVSLPIPVPLTGKYAMTGSGNIDESTWYIGFYNSLDKVMFEDKMKNIE